MTEIKKDIYVSIEGRRRCVHIDSENHGHNSISFAISGGGSGQKYPSYEGPYTFVSMPNEIQIVPTENKRMEENVVVLPIPYSEVSNPEGGLTVCIGG